MITLTGHLICSGEAEAALVRAHLPDHIRLTRAEPGCVSFLVTPTEDPLVWRVEESFADAPAFQAHQTRSRASAWWQATCHIGREFQTRGL
ncbi:antibiotic biosynthesis monooxygenase [Rhodobacter sp. Har01]|uniref:putative quinol monooxygenase n=1 Tax=Rhodobacter sp. Har01 TaxID=2883999 RepID=UPI001D07D77B|nr:antibiotic biosynthesis monooxygenase [Rhodobacter sp. Har01]MCB6177203.1 antibiotic biosynthesis monooxygenase [Rhodobacter sp. Har01]